MEDDKDTSEIELKKGKVIFSEGDEGNEMYLIKSGNVRIYKTSGKIEHTLAVLEEGNFFGEMAILDQSPRSAAAQCLTDITLIKFNKQAFLSHIRKNPFIEFVVSELIKRLRKTSDQFKLLTIPDEELRFATMLMNKAKSFSKDNKHAITLPITSDAGSLASSSGLKENIAKNILDNLEESKLIKYKGKTLIINDMDKFKEYIRYLKLKTKFEEKEEYE